MIGGYRDASEWRHTLKIAYKSIDIGFVKENIKNILYIIIRWNEEWNKNNLGMKRYFDLLLKLLLWKPRVFLISLYFSYQIRLWDLGLEEKITSNE